MHIDGLARTLENSQGMVRGRKGKAVSLKSTEQRIDTGSMHARSRRKPFLLRLEELKTAPRVKAHSELSRCHLPLYTIDAFSANFQGARNLRDVLSFRAQPQFTGAPLN